MRLRASISQPVAGRWSLVALGRGGLAYDSCEPSHELGAQHPSILYPDPNPHHPRMVVYHRCLILLLVALIAMPAAELPSDALERTKAAASQAQAVRLTFVQTKHLEMLDQPLVSTGAMEIDRRGGRMRWQFDHGATLILVGGKLRRWGADGKEENLGNDPAAQAMVGQMQGVLSGNWTVLGDLFTIHSDAQHIEGLPRAADLARYLERMLITVAADGSPQKIELFAHGGDCTTYDFGAADTTWLPRPERFSGP